jgi:hypothetical protein
MAIWKIYSMLHWRERVLAKLGETPFELLKEKEENMVVGENVVEKKEQLLNESLINLLRRCIEMQTKPKSTHGVAINFNRCEIYKTKKNLAINCPKYATSRPKCLKCGGLHRTKNYGLKCNFCGGLGYIEECC